MWLKILFVRLYRLADEVASSKKFILVRPLQRRLNLTTAQAGSSTKQHIRPAEKKNIQYGLKNQNP
jgi:hypothetical protein